MNINRGYYKQGSSLIMKTIFTICLLLTLSPQVLSQDSTINTPPINIEQSENERKEYYPETDPDVVKKIELWRGLKFGLLMHWAPSSQWGIVESWSLCSEDEPWCRRNIDNYDEYKQKYEALKKTFNPVNFNPDKWAEAASEAGMKYVIFTTKHHDGFNMFDSRYTDYKITDSECPFHLNPRADITKEIFNAFRKKGFWAGAYFSKADWRSDFYWWRRFATPDRNVNYDVKKYPERWQKFVEFTHNQIDELMTNYGSVDILWLDAGWVRYLSPEEIIRKRQSGESNTYRFQSQDINMPLIAERARLKQPGIIIVDRDVPGPLQNYLTPENHVPDSYLPYPWETCMPMSSSWSHKQGAKYKSARQLIHLLVDIVAKGGNFLLNIAPSPEGDFDPAAYERLREIGAWMKINGEAIYDSSPVLPYKEGKVCFTKQKDGAVYAIYLADDSETFFPEKLVFKNFSPLPDSKIEILGTGQEINWERKDNGCIITFPESVRSLMPGRYAWTLKISKLKEG